VNYYIDKYNFSVGMTNNGFGMFCRKNNDKKTEDKLIIQAIEVIAEDTREKVNIFKQLEKTNS